MAPEYRRLLDNRIIPRWGKVPLRRRALPTYRFARAGWSLHSLPIDEALAMQRGTRPHRPPSELERHFIAEIAQRLGRDQR